MTRIQYRPLPKYKYQLVVDHEQMIRIRPRNPIATPFIKLSADGLLKIGKDYAWDGPSGPSFDTLNFMRGSLVHDALYQLMRMEHLDYQIHREAADDELRDICIEDGMPKVRAWWVHKGVRLGGKSSAQPPEPPVPAAVWAP
ncbi:MAG: hypothetical protein JWQ90_369 [Hydrocarboniphaga sp.]|uniref:hypothetical protein n=1 Tax=Hydrocarboniphaga sp. TaxID=2033016 RepID=UPI002629A213|nr:hypothetical protein [Hydrocarboniphaga sp.]MDB5967919.1 hypothetical protein [Hydrocarboniphaga sp.]